MRNKREKTKISISTLFSLKH